MIRKRGNKYELVSKQGKVLGTHSSKQAANRQEQAIQRAKRAK